MTFRFIVVVLVSAWMCLPSGATGAIIGTVHDLSLASGANTPYRDTTGAATMCNTCHIPHHTQGNGRPLWNHTLSTVTYSWNEVTTLAGTTLPTSFNAPTGAGSKACLSCHDGSVAIGSVIVGTSWGTRRIPSQFKITGVGNSDMTGNHPVGVPFPDQAGAVYNGITTSANPAKYKSPTVAKIYGTTAGATGIECGSCHDPHDTTTYGSFLRTDEGTLCTDCHNT